jgi:hypothetical protein
MYYSTGNRRLALGFVCLLALLVSACGTAQHAAKLETGYSPPSDVKIQLGEIKNSTGRVYDVDVETMLTDALTETLQKQEMLATGSEGDMLLLNAEIVAYEKGSAFGRWLMPGVGSTILEVHCELRDGNNVAGVADAKRTVDAGGGYTIGAWKSIYKDVAADIVGDISAQLNNK